MHTYPTGHGWCASARAHVQMIPSVSYLENGWTDCAEIWCVVRDQLAMRFTKLRGGVYLYLENFRIFSVSLERPDELRRNLVLGEGTTSYAFLLRIEDIRTSARVAVHSSSTFVRSHSFIAQKASYWYHTLQKDDRERRFIFVQHK